MNKDKQINDTLLGWSHVPDSANAGREIHVKYHNGLLLKVIKAKSASTYTHTHKVTAMSSDGIKTKANALSIGGHTHFTELIEAKESAMQSADKFSVVKSLSVISEVETGMVFVSSLNEDNMVLRSVSLKIDNPNDLSRLCELLHVANPTANISVTED